MVLVEKLKDYKIILASQSPRRQQLLKELGVPFDVYVKKDIPEDIPSNLIREQIVLYLAEHKALAYKDLLKPKTIVITADTIVWLKDKVINKPSNFNEAFGMLKELSGNTHSVYTGVCLSSEMQTKSFFSETSVYFRNITDDEIIWYINNYKPYDKAGAYGVQEWIGYAVVEKIEGCFFNVMGFPLEKFYKELDLFLKTY